jgi:hypothetical protein
VVVVFGSVVVGALVVGGVVVGGVVVGFAVGVVVGLVVGVVGVLLSLLGAPPPGAVPWSASVEGWPATLGV